MNLEEAQKRIARAKKTGANELDLSDCNLKQLPVKELEEISGQITELNISYNNIGDQGAAVISNYFKNLVSLDVSDNGIGKDGAVSIGQSLKGLINLSIWHNNIGHTGANSISQNLRNLVSLEINGNNIGTKGAIAISQNLKKLTKLDISSNEIGDDGAISISQNLESLTELDIRYNNIGEEGAISIKENLENLVSLNIRNNNIGPNGAIIISEGLKSLQRLNIRSNNIGDEGIIAINQGLKNITELDISENSIGDKGAASINENLKNITQLYIRNNKIGDEGITAISKALKKLILLDTSFNEIGDTGVLAICENLKKLTTLEIRNNNLSKAGAALISLNLKRLTHLDISFNKIGDDGATAIGQNLKNLEKLYIWNSDVLDRGIKSLYNAYKDNVGIKIFFSAEGVRTIPPSALSSWDNLQQYFLSVATENRVVLNALNVVLLGNTFSGKSSLQDFYLNDKKKFINKENTDRTWGITHKTINSPLSSNLRLSFWDFGGQEYFHGTHRLFIGGRNALYLVLWEAQYEVEVDGTIYDNKPFKNENNDDCYPAAYWLGTIHHFEQGVDISDRLLVVQSKFDLQKAQLETWPNFFTKKRFGLSPKNCFNLSVKGAAEDDADETKDYYQALWTVFKSRFESLILQQKSSYDFNEEMLKILGDEGLIKWRNEENLFVSKGHFLKLCNEFYKGADDFIMQYLQDCGEIMLFKDNVFLRDNVFISPEGLLNNIYDVLNKKIKDQGGIFSADEIKGKETLLAVMLEMDLVFENPSNQGEFIAPQFMNENAELSKLLGHLRKLLKIAFSLRFPDFMPRGNITRFIAQKGKLAVDGVFWKFGVLYHHKAISGDEIKVLVEADETNRFIRIYADDKPGKYEALKEVFNQFVVYNNFTEEATANADKIDVKNQSELSDKPSSPAVPETSDYFELSADGQNYASIRELNKAIDHNAVKVRDIGGGYMPLDSIFYVLLNKITAMPKKIFFSYSRYDRQYRDEFEIHFSTLKRQGLIATWYDGVIEPGADANAEIMKELLNADIILCLLSPQFMANDYIWNIEMQKAKDAKKTIVPITLRACDYKKYFADYFGEDKQGFLTQKQFNKGQEDEKTKERDIIWIASEQHAAKRDEYYNFIVEGLKKIIAR